ncbi:MAG: hypothetical protein OXU78_10925, partial [Deltaproteobacteria bacterium]|nr:hypothetical protein [Deltaproteobacteria bacterium]
APNVSTDTEFFFQLTVTATKSGETPASASDVVKITVEDDDSPTATIATAGATVTEGTDTMLSSTVADSVDSTDTITARWTAMPSSPAVTFSDDTSTTPTVTWPMVSANTAYTLTLTATDSAGNTGTATVMFTVQDPSSLPANTAPTVSAGTDQTLDEGASVTLSGTVTRGSGDTTGTLDYAWVQITSETNTAAVTTGTNYVGALTGGSGTPATTPLGQSNATFTAPTITASPFRRTYYFQLTGGAVESTVTSRTTATDIVIITVEDATAPSASISTAGATVDESTMTTMAATGTDSESDTVTYSWTVSPSGPTFSDDAILATQVSWPAIAAADRSTDYTLTLTVTDSAGNDATDTVAFTVRDTGAPTASTSGSATSGGVGASVSLSASSSRNAAGGADGLSYAWLQVQSATSTVAVGSPLTLAGGTTATPSFTAPNSATTLYFLLTVTDDVTTRTATARVTVAIVLAATAAPTVSAGNDQTGIDDFDSGGTATTITLAGTAAKATGTGTTTFTYAWTQVSAESGGTEVTSGGTNYAGTITNANAASATVSAPDVATTATIYFQLSVTATESGKGASAPVTDVVAITVVDNEAPTVAFTPAAGNVDEGATTTFANTSSDPDGDTTLTYAWTVNPSSAGTFGDPAGISSTPATLEAPNIVWADVAAATRSLDATVRLTVTDSQGNSAFSEVIYTVLDKNGTPTSMPGTTNANNRVEIGTMGTLDGDDSTNAGGVADTDLTYSWLQVSAVNTQNFVQTTDPSYAGLSSTTAANPTFTAPSAATTLYFRLRVRDTQTTQQHDAWVTVSVVEPRAVIIDQIGASATQAAVSEGGSFGFRATRRDGVMDVDGALSIVATLSATPSTGDNDYETADFSAASGTLMVAAADNSGSAYNLITVQNDTLLEGTESYRVTFTLTGSTIPVIVSGTSSNTWDGNITD